MWKTFWHGGLVTTCCLLLYGSVVAQVCNTQKCLVVRYEDDGKGRNKYCILQDSEGWTGFAYSTSFADPQAYGTEQKAGTPQTEVNGHRYAVTGTSDCQAPVTRVSGTVTKYNDGPFNLPFKTECKAS